MKYLLAIVILFCLASCKEDDDIREAYRYRAFIEAPNGKIEYIGKVKGLSSCKYAAKAALRKKDDKHLWKVTCCWRYQGDKCLEAHE